MDIERACEFLGIWERGKRSAPFLVGRDMGSRAVAGGRDGHWVPGREIPCPDLCNDLAVQMLNEMAARGYAVNIRCEGPYIQIHVGGFPEQAIRHAGSFAEAVVIAIERVIEKLALETPYPPGKESQ